MSAFKVAVVAATLLWLAAVGYATYATYQRAISQAEPIASNPGTYRLNRSQSKTQPDANPAEPETLTGADIVKQSLGYALACTVPLWLFTLALLAAIRFANRDQEAAKT